MTTKPDDIPKDVWDEAFYIMDDFALLTLEDDEGLIQRAIPKAILKAKNDAYEEAAMSDQREDLYAINKDKAEYVRLHDGRLMEISTDADNFYRPEIKSMARELLELRAAITAMTPPAPWSDRE